MKIEIDLCGAELLTTAASFSQIEMKGRHTSEENYPVFIQYLVDISFPRAEKERTLDTDVQNRYSEAYNIDSIVIAASVFPAVEEVQRV